MIHDACSVPTGEKKYFDICIIGAGAAGMTLACELANKDFQVSLLESGGMHFEAETQRLYEGQVVSHEHHGALDQYRQRRFGGTTVVWGGRCAPFDAIDFESRSYVPNSGWPITKEELDPYYQRAHHYLEIGDYTYEVKKAIPGPNSSLIPGFTSDDISEEHLWRFSPPTNFAKKHSHCVTSSPNITTFSHANCLKLVPDKTGTSINFISVSSLRRNIFSVHSKFYILATGGLEVPRLLLVSNDVHKEGIGNQKDLVGRFYISHLAGDVGQVQLAPKNGEVIFNYEKTFDGIYCRRTLSIPENIQRKKGLLNIRFSLSHPPPGNPQHQSAVLSAMYLVKRLLTNKIPPEYGKDLASKDYKYIGSHMKNVVMDSINLAKFSAMWMQKRILSNRKLPSVEYQNKNNIYNFHFDAEQSPLFSSCVGLSGEKDIFGINKLKVDWRFSEDDIKSITRSINHLNEALKRSGSGRLLNDTQELPNIIRGNVAVGSHHIGTTRMAADSSQGVVDRNCCIFGINNLYIASSSVFPTSSFANPTLTIVALAIRIADRIKGLMQDLPVHPTG